ncbi:UNVERIFIED_CONTAM: hypothetical protein PYX00_001405 [Menopon gallinae]|uniref:Amino acid transporter transmembrane domain-containing protein n=1 Tax=Menopon gallinae TaxID=328185 RepID=A0AAW2ICJ6_9NEOP
MEHDNSGSNPLKLEASGLSTIGSAKTGDQKNAPVEEYNLTPVSKQGYSNNGRRHSKGHRATRQFSQTTQDPSAPVRPRRRSIAGTFVTDPTLKLPPRPKAQSFAHDGRRDDVKDANGVYVVDAEGKSKEPEGEYDPYCERIVDHPTTNAETLLHLIKGSLGTGILAMPNAFYHAGWALGVCGTTAIGMICTYCIHLLIKCEYEICKRRRLPALNYPSTGEAALLEGPSVLHKLAPVAPHVINFFVLAYQLGICCVYVVFVSENVKGVVDQYTGELDVRIYMVIFLLPLILINYVRNLKYLAPFSSIANIITFVGFAITLYYIFTGLPSLSERDPVGQIKHWPLFFGTVLFSLEAIGVIMPLENEMKTPKSFGGPFGVLNQAMAMIIALYVGMGFFGYLKYGNEAKGSITLNLPKNEIPAQVVKIMMALAIFITHSLQCYVAIDIIWTGYLLPKYEKSAHKVFYEYVVRTCLVLFTFLVAVAIPNLEYFISLIGALCLSALGIAFPAIIQTATYWYQKTGTEFYLMCLKNFLLVAFGIVGLIIGTYVSLSDIITHFFT